ncbi:M6 family metalloprotease domain-containing protein [Geomonas sp. RF6]|uniref:M6 family metalloprotease domain-containing protein n=1 Tax=Geomonas sp. RF6 TaxID=2897342 RepID=UPI001E53AD0A|nr:M6 family metalloprotease domain-containing protein [Geomonas sp. RF6]UFS68797.1 M6 family metalloprotease domain-containing protein [Geomonas sp. RF6]
MRKFITCCLQSALLLLLGTSLALAGPAMPTPTEVKQPDGAVLQIQIRGDEYQNWIELQPSGHTIIRNQKSGYWEYAEKSPDGTLKPSGIKAEPAGRNAPDFLPPRAKPQRNQELEKQLLEQRALERALSPAQTALKAPTTGTRKALVILVNFSNRSLVTTPGGWYGKIFDTTPGVKSLANFYHDNSYGAITVAPAAHTQSGNPPGIITATITDPHPNYGGDISYSADTAVANHALLQASSYIDFASYDTNGDHYLQPEELAIYFIYAGYEASGSWQTPSVWAHAWWGGSITAGTETVTYWALNGELNDRSVQHPMGVIVHEMGHALFSLIDLYDTSYTNEALGNFSTMAAGSWGADIGEDGGTTPTNLDAWSRNWLGWSQPVEPGGGGWINLQFADPSASSTSAYHLAHPSFSNSEYFLIENRRPSGWDRGLRGFLGADWAGGLLVLHVDDDVYSNQYVSGSHQKVVPVQASTSYCDMLAIGSYCRGHATTLFYKGNNDSWTQSTIPNSNYYNGTQSGFNLNGISVPQGIMTALYNRDAIPPTVTAFALPQSWDSLTVPITAFTAADNIRVAGFLLTETSVTPSTADGGWSSTPPASYTFGTPGLHTLYAWAKDEDGTVSSSRSATVRVTVVDSAAPIVTAFSVPATSSTLTVAITTLTATDDVGVTGYLVNESAAKPAAGAAGWSASAPGSYTFPSAGEKTLYAWAKDAAGNVSASRSATVTVGGGGLPAPWVTQDVGSVGLTGSAGYQNGVFTLRGAGADIWGSADGFRFVYQAMTGDGTITARVASLQNTNGYAKAGVMMRQSLTANSIHAMAALTPVYGAEFSVRTSTGGSTAVTGAGGVAAPYWVRLVRSGNTFTGYISPNGTTWRQVGSSTIAMGNTIYVGVVACSHSVYALTTATLDSVSVPGSDTTAPVVTAFSIPATSASLTIPITSLGATDNIGVSGYLVNESATKPAASAPAWSAAPPSSYTFASYGAKTLYAWAKDAAGNVSDSRSATVTVSGGDLPVPWAAQDVGSVGIAGSASYSSDTFTIRGAGGDIWGNADAFRFVYRTLDGDGQIVARVASLQNTNGYAKAGVMFRQSLAANSIHAMMVLTPGYGAEFSRRTATGGSTTVTGLGGMAAPYWVKLVRSGNTFTGYVSSNGTDWRQAGSSSITMGSSLYVGLAVCSHNTALLSQGTFDNVIAIGGTSPTVTITSPSNGAIFNAPATVPVSASATPGSAAAAISKVDFYAGSTLIGTATAGPYSVIWRNVAAGSYPLTAVATDSLGNRGNSAPVTITVSTLPAPWTTLDVGPVTIAGSASYASGTFTLKGSGIDIWGAGDAFRFVYKAMTGDGEIIARVASLQNTNSYAKSGVMMRETLATDSAHVTMDVTPGNGAEFLRRGIAGGTMVSSKKLGVTAPYWVRLVRSGNTFSGYVSSNGTTWELVGTSSISMKSTLYVGLVVCSHNTSALSTATIDGVLTSFAPPLSAF